MSLNVDRDYPLMLGEILEAIHNTYVDEPYVEIDCYLYLRHALSDYYDRMRCVEKLESMNRCDECGSPLETSTYKELHTEVNPPAYEYLTDKYCPECLGLNRD